jgi:hypothetical protein
MSNNMILVALIIILLLVLWFITMPQMEQFIVNPNPPKPSAITGEIKKMTLTTNLISNIKTATKTSLPISQYAIKAAYNAANSGTFVSTDAIKYVIGRGCRLLDFEVYIDATNTTQSPIAIVAYSTKIITPNTDTTMVKLDSANTLPLEDVFSTIISNAFNATSAPNYGDPIFLHLRMKTGSADLLPFLRAMRFLGPKMLRLRRDEYVTANTPLSKLMGRIILIINGNNVIAQAGRLQYLMNMMGGAQWRTYRYRDIENMAQKFPTININGISDNVEPTTDITKLTMVLPASATDTIVPSPSSIFAEYGMQTLLVPFYSYMNNAVIQYEQLFNTCNGGIVPLPVMISYSKELLDTKPRNKENAILKKIQQMASL